MILHFIWKFLTDKTNRQLLAEIALSVNEMPKHNHDTATSTTDGSVTTTSNGSHSHSISVGESTTSSAKGAEKGTYESGWAKFNSDAAGSHTHTAPLKARGAGAAHENRPPYIVLNYIIKIK